ncbi:MAG: ATP-dependent DNA helicase [Rhodospirillales bacterium]|nr:ATP-dependent DNA helicase [Alphaproteobacteria bacterium]MBL6947221.1 ATP-dependent DNA helicase [Rhodospirillales bacterium]
MNAEVPSPALLLPRAPALVCGVRQAAWLSPDGEIEDLTLGETVSRLNPRTPPIVCHAGTTARRLGINPFPAFDVLELFAFVRPARFVLPTPRGLAEALNLALPGTLEREAESLLAVSGALLAELAERAQGLGDAQAAPIARAMKLGGWPWVNPVLAALGEAPDSPAPTVSKAADALRIWARLPDWEEQPPEPPPGNEPVDDAETRERLAELLGGAAEKRTEQVDYAVSCGHAFQPREANGEPLMVLAEAGTGVGKTLGYIAPASVWAEKNLGSVWISTFTRNLQRQLDGELDRLFPDAEEKARRVVIRKGRENYFCLLNFEEALGRNPATAIGGGGWTALGLMARWALATRDGDMIGGDFPAWLKGLLGGRLTTDLTDTRGECIYSACRHYGKCFIEHTVRRARSADIVVANHALVMIQAALGNMNGGGLENGPPLRFVFDEGHHLFGAADSAFSAHLTARETADLRRWLTGAESGSRSRSRGLRERIKDLIAGDDKAEECLDETLKAAGALPATGWGQRLGTGQGGGQTTGVAEAFFALVRAQVYARDPNEASGYSLETETTSPVDGLLDAATRLDGALARLGKPIGNLIGALAAKLDTEADSLDSQTRTRIETVCRSLERRGRQSIAAWRGMLAGLDGEAHNGETPEDVVDWFAVDRIDGRDFDIGLHRHWVDPTKPFAEAVIEPAHGVVVTSATLRDGTGDLEVDWRTAEQRTGAAHLSHPAELTSEPSPFDYAGNTRVLIVDDVARNNTDQTAAAYRELFLAAGGGGLGLFTAISRLRAVADRIAGPLEDAGLTLLAQHVDALDTGTLVDIFRAEEHSCLLGTDAVRDGVDVPGRSLRLIVFDRVPWPRPDILHKRRKRHFGGKAYDDMLTRAKLKQAFGRLVRRAEDRGVFVMLDKAMPSRLLGAFPEGVTVERLGLKDAIAHTRAFLSQHD